MRSRGGGGEGRRLRRAGLRGHGRRHQGQPEPPGGRGGRGLRARRPGGQPRRPRGLPRGRPPRRAPRALGLAGADGLAHGRRPGGRDRGGEPGTWPWSTTPATRLRGISTRSRIHSPQWRWITPVQASGVRQELSFPELVGVLYRWRWLLFGSLLLGGAGGVGAVMAIPPAYTAQAVLLLDPQPTRLATTGVSPEATPLDSGVVDSQAQILASRSLAQQAIDKLGLVNDPELAGQPAGLARAVDRLAADRDGAGLAAAGTDPVARFLERLDVRREGKSYVITLAYRSTDAVKAAQVANTVAQLYLAGQLERKTATTRAARELLTVQTEAAHAQLDEVQQRLQAFRTGAEPVALARPAGSDDEVAEINRQLVLASADRIAAETRLNQLRTSLTDGHPGALDSGSVLLQNLSALKADVLRREAELWASSAPATPACRICTTRRRPSTSGSARRSGPDAQPRGRGRGRPRQGAYAGLQPRGAEGPRQARTNPPTGPSCWRTRSSCAAGATRGWSSAPTASPSSTACTNPTPASSPRRSRRPRRPSRARSSWSRSAASSAWRSAWRCSSCSRAATAVSAAGPRFGGSRPADAGAGAGAAGRPQGARTPGLRHREAALPLRRGLARAPGRRHARAAPGQGQGGPPHLRPARRKARAP